MDVFDQFDQWNDSETGSEEAKRGAVGEIATGIERGAVVHLPEMAGQAVKWFSEEGSPVYEAAESMRLDAELRGQDPEIELQPEAHGTLTNALASGGEMLVPSVAPQLLATVGDVLFPPAGPALHTAAAGVTGVLYGASQAQSTYENVLDATDDKTKARLAGIGAGLTEGGGEALASAIGGKYLSGALKVLGPKGGTVAARVIERARNPKAIKNFVAATGMNAASEVGTEMMQNAGSTMIERAAGVENGPTPMEAAKEAIAPTLGLSALMLPLGGLGAYRANRQTRTLLNTLESADAAPKERSQAAAFFYEQMAGQDQDGADIWAAETLAAIADGKPISIVESSTDSTPDGGDPISVEGLVGDQIQKVDEAVAPSVGMQDVPEIVPPEAPVVDQGQPEGVVDGVDVAHEAEVLRETVTRNAHVAATSPENSEPEPTPAQKEAGNYKKGHVKIHGLDISIENPKGSQRSGVDPDGQKWSVDMPAHYGYVKRTEGADGDHVDVYIGEKPESDRVFIVDQYDIGTGAFDEHKVILGAENRDEAEALYEGGFSDGRGRDRIGGLTEMSVGEFKGWLESGNQMEPVSSPGDEVADSDTEAVQAIEPDELQRELVDEIAYVEDQLKSSSSQPIRNRLRDELDGLVRRRDFINKKVDELGSVAAVDGFYSEDDAVGRYARQRAQDVFSQKAEAVEAEAHAAVDVQGENIDGAGSDLVVKKDGSPFPSERSAKMARTVRGLKNSHEVVPIDGGFALRESVVEQPPGSDQEVDVGQVRGVASVDGEAGRLNTGSVVAENDNAGDSETVDQLMEQQGEIEGVDTTIAFNTEKNGIEISFGDKPGSETIAELKKNGFRFSRKQKLWWAKKTDMREAFARSLAGEAVQTSSDVKMPEESAFDSDNTVDDVIPHQTEVEDGYGSSNRLVTKDRAEELRQKLRAKLSQLNSGIDPEMLAMGTELAVYHIEAGARSFVKFSKAMAGDLGAKAKPFLKAWYMGAKNWPGMDKTGMDSESIVDALNVDDIVGETETKGVDNGESQSDIPTGGSGVVEASEPERAGAVEAGEKIERISGRRGQSVRESGAVDHRADDKGSADINDGQGREAAQRKNNGPRGDSGRFERVSENDNGSIAKTNYRISEGDSIGKGGAKTKARDNLTAIKTINTLLKEERPATSEEQAALVKYVGWGSSELANGMFPQRKYVPEERKYGEVYKDGWASLGGQLRELLGDDAYAAARRSTQNAHYTSPEIIRGMYGALERFGFSGGRILEPGSGIGHFIGLLPDRLIGSTRFTAIEMDHTTAEIAKALYPGHDVRRMDFAEFKAPDGFYDVAIGNPPFADIEILGDPDYAKHKLKLHDFFFVKSLDKVRPGGLMMLVTSRYTMDKANDRARTLLSKQADLVGAIRLPQTAFKENAGTEVVTDVLFLRKRLDGERPSGESWAELAEVKTVDKGTAWINEYYKRHPEMVLGRHSLTGSMYGGNQYTVTPKRGDIADLFAKAVESLPEGIYQDSKVEVATQQEADAADFAPESIKEGAFFVGEDGAVYTKEDGVGVKSKASGKTLDKLKHFIRLRDAVRNVLYVQIAEEGDLASAQRDLDGAYSAFVKKFGPVNKESKTERKNGATIIRYPNFSTFKSDPDAYLVAAIEHYDSETGAATKADIFSQRVISPKVEPKIESLTDALHVTLFQTGRVDMAMVAGFMGVTEEQAIDGLGEAIYHDPAAGQWVTDDEYLSGNVREKLAAAKSAAQIDAKYKRNIEALISVQPEDLPPSRIPLSLGMPILDEEHIEAFSRQVVGMTIKVSHLVHSGDWGVERVSGWQTAQATSDYGTGRVNAAMLIDAALNSKPVKVFDTFEENGQQKRVLNKVETEAANAKLQKVKERFSSWVWEDAERADMLARRYNDSYNNIVPRRYGGDHVHQMQFPGMTATKSPREHQRRVAWRIVQKGNTYMAHSVGAGKTIASILAGMELKRLGIKKKPMWVVPNHMLKQFASEFLELYPAAKVMVADEEQFSAANRNRFMGRVAAENWDAIIITHAAFKKIPMSADYQRQFIDGQIDELDYLIDLNREERSKVKQIERQKQRLEERLKKILSSADKDKGVNFEETGVDQIFVDEAQEFRKLDFATNQSNIKGIDPNGSLMAFDLYAKTRYLESLYPGRSLVLMSGTPLTSTIGELYTVQRYLQEPLLRSLGLHNFDAWAATFGDMVSDLEATPAGTYRPVSRFAKFKGLAALSGMWSEVGDFVHAKDLPYLKRPRVEGGGRQVVIGEQSDLQKAYKRQLARRIELIEKRTGPPQKGDDIILSVITDGRHAALDDRYISPAAPVSEWSKIEKMIGRVADIWRETDGEKSTQMIFSDLGLPGSEEKRGFSAYKHIRSELVALGIPENEIAFMQDYKKSDEKLKLFRAMNDGKVRVLIGSSQAMGTGVNAQERLVALHHLDPNSYLPSWIEQREGRIVRQGNRNEKVQLYAYVTRGSYDETMWQFLETKQRFIDQFLAGKAAEDEASDIDGSADQFAVARAMSSDNPLILEKAGVENDINKLEALHRAHMDDQRRLARERSFAEKDIPKLEERIAKLLDLSGVVVDTSGSNFKMEFDGVRFKERKVAGAAILSYLKDAAKNRTIMSDEVVGSLGGFDVSADVTVISGKPHIVVSVGRGSDVVGKLDFSESGLAEADPVGLIMKLENAIKSLSGRIDNAKSQIAKQQKIIRDADERIGRAFEHADALSEKRKRLDEINDELAREGSASEAEADDGEAQVKHAIDPFIVGDSGIGDVDISPAKPLPFVKKVLSDEGLESVLVKGGRVDEVKAVARAFGKKIVFFQEAAEGKGQWSRFGRENGDNDKPSFGSVSNLRGGRGQVGAFVHPSRPDILFLNAQVKSHALFMVGHELGHAFLMEDAAAWNNMAEQLRPLVRNWSGYEALLDDPRYAGLTEEDRYEEFVSDVIGQNFLNEAFWWDMSQLNPSLFKRIAKKAVELLTRAINALTGRSASPFVSDMVQARAIISRSLVEYGKNVSAGKYSDYSVHYDAGQIAERVDGRKILNRLRDMGVGDDVLTKAFASLKLSVEPRNGKTFDPLRVSTERLPDIVTHEKPVAGGGRYFYATAERLQQWLDRHGDGFLYRVTIGEAIDQGFDHGRPGYSHQFEGLKAKVHSFTSNLEDAKRIAAETPGAIVYRAMPQDISEDFSVQVYDGPKGVVHVQSPRPASTGRVDVIYRAGERWSEAPSVDESRRFVEQRRAGAETGYSSGGDFRYGGRDGQARGGVREEVRGDGVESTDDGDVRYFVGDRVAALTEFSKKMTPDVSGVSFQTLGDWIPERMKAAVASVLSNPHYGSKKSPWRSQAYELALERGANANEIKHDIMSPAAGYAGLEGLRDSYRSASKQEREQIDKLLIEGDINGVEFSEQDLDSGKTPLGKAASGAVKSAYLAFRQTISKSTKVMFDRLGRLRLLPYEGTEFYQELIDLLDEGLTVKELEKRLGIDQSVVDAYHRIMRSRKKLDEALQPYRDAPMYDTLRDAFFKHDAVGFQASFGLDKEMMAAYWSISRQVGEFVTASNFKKARWYKSLIDVLTVGPEHPMLRKLDLFNAYQGVKEYDSQLAKLKQQWREAKGYVPRIRKDGEWHVKVYEVHGDGEYTEVFMQPRKTKGGADKLKKELDAGAMRELMPHSYDEDAHYEVVVEPNQSAPEEIFMGIGSHRAIEALLSRAFERAVDAGVIEDHLAVQQQVLRILADEISARGFGRHRISRAEHLIEGYETENTPALLAQFVGGMAGWLSKSEFAMRGNQLMSEIPSTKRADQVWVREYMDDALKNSTYLDQWFGTARSFAALMYLGFKASSAILNATQNYIWGQAKLSKYAKGATRRLLSAQRDVVKDHLLRKAGKGSILSEEEQWVLEEGSRRGRSQANYVRAMAGMDDTGGVMGSVQSSVRWVTERAMVPFQMVETYWNREPALLAAYRVFRGEGASKEDALKKAERFVDDVHFVVGKENIPALLRKMGPIGRTLYTFQSYTHNYLLGMAASLGAGEYGVVMRSLTALVLFGGLSAVPFGDDLDKWYRRVYGERPLRMLEKWLHDTADEYTDFGDQIADFVMHGVPALAGVNFSRSIAVNIPWLSPEDDSLAERVTGVWGGMAQKVRYAGKAAARGDAYRAVESLSPEALANVMRAYRLYADGATTMTGRPVFGGDGKPSSYQPGEAFLRVFGFMPLGPSKESQERWDAVQGRAYWQEKKTDVLAHFRKALRGSSADRKEAMRLVIDFNKALRSSDTGVLVAPISVKTLKSAGKASANKRDLAYYNG